MFYELELQSHVRVDPKTFSEDVKESILKNLNKQFDNYISKEIGVAIAVSEVLSVGDGIIIPGDGAAYYDTKFKLLVFKPEQHEVVLGKITEMTDFGAFMNIGPIDGMIHISQAMDDFVSFSKSGVLTGKESGKSIKVGDKCRARIIAVSYKDVNNPKIGLTMRQPLLGKIDDIEKGLKKKAAKPKEKAEKTKKKKTKEK